MVMLLELGSIKGESKIGGRFDDKIEIVSWGWAMRNKSSGHWGGGAGTGKAQFASLKLTKFMDKASPRIIKNLFLEDGNIYAGKFMIVDKVDKQYQESFVINLTNTWVSSYECGPMENDPELYWETFGLDFEQYEIVCNASSGAVRASYNLITQKEK